MNRSGPGIPGLFKDQARGTQLRNIKGRRDNKTHTIDMRRERRKTRPAFKIKTGKTWSFYRFFRRLKSLHETTRWCCGPPSTINKVLIFH